MDQTTKKPRGFQCMDPDFQKRVASSGGQAAHRMGRAHKWTSETAAAAGRKGGETRAARHRERLALQQANAVQSTQQEGTGLAVDAQQA